MRVAERQRRILLALRPPCLWALYKKTKHFIQERTQRKQTSKQINKQKKRGENEDGQEHADTALTRGANSDCHPPPLPRPPVYLSRSPSSLHTLTTPSHHPSVSTYKHVHTLLHARQRAISRTPTSAVGISPMEQLAEVQVVPGWLLSLCLAQHSPLPAQRPHPILPELPHLTEKELAEYPHYAASLRQQKQEQRTTKKTSREGD